MSDDLYFVRTLGGLKPADESTEEAIKRLGIGEVVRAELKGRERSGPHHRLLMGIIGMVFKNQETYLSQEGLLFAIKIAAGYVDHIQVGDQVHLKPKSISFKKMKQPEFDDFYPAALAAIPRILPQFNGMDLEAELRMYSTR